MWQTLNRSDTLLLLKPEGFAAMGIHSPLYAAGLCDYSTILGYWDNYSIKIIAFLLGQNIPGIVEVKLWFHSKEIPRRELMKSFNKLKRKLMEMKITYAFMYCTHRPLHLTAQLLGANARQVHVGTFYEWRLD